MQYLCKLKSEISSPAIFSLSYTQKLSTLMVVIVVIIVFHIFKKYYKKIAMQLLKLIWHVILLKPTSRFERRKCHSVIGDMSAVVLGASTQY